MIIKIFCLLLCIFCFSELQNITAAQFLVLKDSTRTYAHLEDVIEAIVPNFKISHWKNINKLATKHYSRENYDYSVIQEDTSDPFSVGPCCSENGIYFNKLFEKSEAKFSLTVEQFLELCKLKKTESFKWQDVEVWISNIARINAAQISIIKLYTLLIKKREKLSKNKTKEDLVKLNKSLLSDFLRDSVEDNIVCDTEKRTKQENKALKSTIDKMFNGQIELQSKAKICAQIVREQSKKICGLEQSQRDTISMHVNLKKKCKKIEVLSQENEVRKKDVKKRNLTHQEAEFL